MENVPLCVPLGYNCRQDRPSSGHSVYRVAPLGAARGLAVRMNFLFGAGDARFGTNCVGRRGGGTGTGGPSANSPRRGLFAFFA